MRKKLRFPLDLALGELHSARRAPHGRRSVRRAKRQRARFARRALRELDDLHAAEVRKDGQRETRRRTRRREPSHVCVKTGPNSWDVVYRN